MVYYLRANFFVFKEKIHTFFLNTYILQSRWCIAAQHMQDLNA